MTDIKSRRASIVSIGILAILVLTKILLSPLGILDDLWNYNIARGIASGYTPYVDINFPHTPFFFLVFSWPLLIKRTFFVYRLTSAAILFLTSFMVRKVVSSDSGRRWGTISAFLTVVFTDIVTYNGMVFLTAILIWDLLRSDLNKRRAFCFGVLCSLSILSRQTTGTVLAAASFIMVISDKAKRKHAWFVFGGGVFVMILFASYLLATGSFAAFWDYCFFSLITFGGDNGMFLPSAVLFLLMSAAGIVSDIVLIRKYDKKYLYHLVLGICLFTIGLPIMDMMHLLYSGLWFLFPVIKMIFEANKDRIGDNILRLIAAIIAAQIVVTAVLGLGGTVFDNEHEELKLVPIPSDILHDDLEINRICNTYREEGKNVTVLSSGEVIFSLLNGEFDYPFDMFLNGNVGTTPPLSYIEQICADPDSVIVIPENYHEENRQNPEGVFEYVNSHMVPVERYGIYIWYEHP